MFTIPSMRTLAPHLPQRVFHVDLTIGIPPALGFSTEERAACGDYFSLGDWSRLLSSLDAERLTYAFIVPLSWEEARISFLLSAPTSWTQQDVERELQSALLHWRTMLRLPRHDPSPSNQEP